MPKGDYKQLKADPEDGTTPIAWIFLEAIASARLSGLEVRCILYLWRETYGRLGRDGVRPKEKELSLGEWKDHTGAETSRLSEALAALVGHNILFRESPGMGKPYKYWMNTRIYEWSDEIIDKKKLSENLRIALNGTVAKNVILLASESGIALNGTVAKTEGGRDALNGTPVVSNSGTLKKVLKESTTTTENKDKHIYMLVEGVLEILPKVSGWAFERVADKLWVADLLGDFPETQLSEIKACTEYYSSKGPVDKGVWKKRLRQWMKNEREWHKDKGVRNGKGSKDTGQRGKERVAGSRPKEEFTKTDWFGNKQQG